MKHTFLKYPGEIHNYYQLTHRVTKLVHLGPELKKKKKVPGTNLCGCLK